MGCAAGTRLGPAGGAAAAASTLGSPGCALGMSDVAVVSTVPGACVTTAPDVQPHAEWADLLQVCPLSTWLHVCCASAVATSACAASRGPPDSAAPCTTDAGCATSCAVVTVTSAPTRPLPPHPVPNLCARPCTCHVEVSLGQAHSCTATTRAHTTISLDFTWGADLWTRGKNCNCSESVHTRTTFTRTGTCGKLW